MREAENIKSFKWPIHRLSSTFRIRFSMSSFAPITQFGTVTSFIPLTTAWPTHSGCSSVFFQHEFGNPVRESNPVVFDPGLQVVANISGNPVDCLPVEVIDWWLQADYSLTSTVLSIGPMTCPDGYGTSASSKVDQITAFIACCPS